MSNKDQIIGKISSFPTLPTIASKLMGMLNNPDVSASEIARVIQYDPALTANLLKAANSVYLGQTRTVNSLAEAFFRLGTKWVYEMSVSSLIYSNLRRPVSGYELSAKDLWRHSMAVAQMSDILCNCLNISETSAAFTAGLLHDMGKIILGEFVFDAYKEIQILVTKEKIPFEKAEKQIIGMDHAEVGGMTAEKWNFPPAIVEGIRWHHQPEKAETYRQITDIVHIADATCLIQGLGIGSDDIHYRLNNNSIDRLKLTAKTLEQAVSRLLSALEEINLAISDESVPETVGRS
jgi:putative nucleotidyltransferase with HDIG domain